jgi:D-sedoheptulose 7-phosphate isomerase
MEKWLKDYIGNLNQTLTKLPFDKINGVLSLLAKANRDGKQIFAFGNGGSASSASHFIADLGKGSSDKTKRRFRSISLSDNSAWITALGNDYAYEDVYMRQLMNFGQQGDIVITMSVSGNSPNLVKAFEWANKNGLETVALVGGKKGKLADMARHVIVIDSPHYGVVEDAHMIIAHMLAYAFMENPQIAD